MAEKRRSRSQAPLGTASLRSSASRSLAARGSCSSSVHPREAELPEGAVPSRAWDQGRICLGVFASILAVAFFAGSVVAQEPAKKDASADAAFWPLGFEIPGLETKPDKKGVPRAPILVWTPPQAKKIRAILIVPNNSDSKHFGEHASVRAVATKQEMAIVFLRLGDEPQIQEILNAAAEKTGIAEFRHAPWIPFGKSSRGLFPALVEWNNPKRTIASISFHGETPTWPPPKTAKLADETILHVNANGESEWGGTWFRHVRPSLLNYRAHTNWLPHQVVAKDVGHGDYVDVHGGAGWGKSFPEAVTVVRVWDYLALFIDKAIELRVPKDKYATEGPIALKQVDESSGYLIDPFAVETLFRQPRFPLTSAGKEFVVDAKDDAPTSGFAAIPPANDYVVPEGVPVAPPAIGRSPTNWLVTEGMRFALKKDPMVDLGGLKDLRPKSGDKVTIDSYEATFRPLAPKHVAPKGGIAVGALKNGPEFSIVGYTVLDVPETMRLKLHAPFSIAGRHQIVLAGVPVEHKQVVELQKGLYPMLLVLRLKGVGWNAVDPRFDVATDEDVRHAKEFSITKAARRTEFEKFTREALNAPPPIHRAADVPADQRKSMFWVADREQAEAWLRLHAVHGQTFDKDR